MKKIHKKIGAMALAGMVVAGGIAASGGSSHAASLISRVPQAPVSKVGLDSLSVADQCSVREAQEIVKKVSPNGIVVAVSKSSGLMDNFIKRDPFFKKPHVRKRLLKDYPVHLKNANVLEKELRDKKKDGKKFLKCQYDDLIFLFML